MKKLFITLFVAAFIQQSFCQTETFDIATFKPPKDWKKDSKQGVVTYIDINKTKGGFCMLAIYASTTSSGDPQKDFNKEWNDLVVVPFKAEANPKTETQTSTDGWKAVVGAAAIKIEGIDAYIVLNVFSGFGKTLSVLVNLNDQSYLAQVDELLVNMKLDKTKTKTGNSTSQSTAVANNATTQNKNMEQKFGNILYYLPAGWEVKKYSTAEIISPQDLAKGELLEIRVLQPLNLSGSLDQTLQQSYDEACQMLKATKMHDVNGGNYSKQEVKKSFKGWEYIRCNGGIQAGNGEYKDEYGLDLFVIKLNNRFERVAVVNSRNSCNLSRFYPYNRLNYYNDIENFLFGLKFTDWKEPVVKAGSISGDGIVGAWQGISLAVGVPKPGAVLGAELKVTSALFFSNGQAYFGTKFPIEGLDELNTWIRAENDRRHWATYSFVNGKGVLKMPYGDIPVRMEANKLIITSNKTDHGFIKMKSVDGARFNGNYTFSSKNFIGEETGKTPTINFTPDGKFTDNGAISVMYHEYVDCLNRALIPGSGNYEVKNHSVIFSYNDGRKIKIAFLGNGFNKNNPSPASLTMSAFEDEMRKQ